MQEAVAQAAQEWGTRAGKAANIAGKAAGPFMRTVAQAGLDSFVAGAASMAQSVKKH